MILDSLELENWKVFREPHRFEFEPGFNLLVGPNESGKSTLLKALTVLFFRGTTSTGGELAGLQPYRSSLAPKGSAVFQYQNQTCRLTKQYLHAPSSLLEIARGGRFERTYEGSAAEEFLRRVCSSPNTSDGRGDQRGLYHALWYLQYEKAIPERWTEGVKQGLGTVVDMAARSPEERRLESALKKEYTRHFTPKRARYKHAPINVFDEELRDAELQYRNCCDEYNELIGLRTMRKSLQEQHDQARERLAKVKGDSDALAPALAQIPAWEEEVRQRSAQVDEKEKESRALEDDLAAYTERLKTIREGEDECRGLSGRMQAAEAAASTARAASAAQLGEIAERIEPALESLRSKARAIRTVQEYRRCRDERNGLASHQSAIGDVEARIQLLEEERKAISVPEPSLLAQWRKEAGEIQRLKAQVDGGAVHVEIALEGGQQTPIVAPEPMRTDGFLLLTAPTTITFPGVGSIRISGMSEDIQTSRETAERLQHNLAQELDRYGAESLDVLDERSKQALQVDLERKDLDRRRAELVAVRSADDAAARIAVLDGTLGNLEAGSADALTAYETLSAEELAAAGRSCDADEEALSEEKRGRSAESEEQLATAGRADKARNEAAIALAQAELTLKGHRDLNNAILDKHGDLDRLRSSSETTKQALDGLRTENELFVGKKRREIARLRGEEERNAEERLECEQNERQAGDAHLKAKERYDTLSERDLEGEKELFEQEVALAQGRYAVARRQADAILALSAMVQRIEAEQTDAIGRPLQEQVRRWLPTVTDGRYTDIELDPRNLTPEKIYNERYEGMFPLADLSFGAHEQVVILLRLALGVVLSQKERQLVVLDDRLVNADPARMENLCSVLKDVAKDSCQIILATCDERPYEAIGGTVIQMPGDGAPKR